MINGYNENNLEKLFKITFSCCLRGLTIDGSMAYLKRLFKVLLSYSE